MRFGDFCNGRKIHSRTNQSTATRICINTMLLLLERTYAGTTTLGHSTENCQPQIDDAYVIYYVASNSGCE